MECTDGKIYQDILSFIRQVRDIFPDADEVCLKGQCVRFAILLNTVFPEGRVYWDEDHAHFVCRGLHYDITGEVLASGIPIEEYGILRIKDLLG